MTATSDADCEPGCLAPPIARKERSALLMFEPEPSQWSELLRKGVQRRDADMARRTREQLGLPANAPIIMTGHQASFWHAGILAKYLACDAASGALGAAPAWIVVDQDANSLHSFQAPMIDESGRLRERHVALTSPGDAHAANIATGSHPPLRPPPLASVERFALESVSAGAARILDSLRRHHDAPTAGVQLAESLADLMAPMIPAAPTVFATALHETDLFAQLVERMADDPRLAAETYNAAVKAHPRAGVAALETGDSPDDNELPLWRLAPGQPRRRVHAGELHAIAIQELAPRALTLTALLRLGACDLFIHGAGGGTYDVITERWIRDWLGAQLAPAVVVSATLTLPLPGADIHKEQVNHALWLARSARHNPSAIGVSDAADQKRELLGAIITAKKQGRQPSTEFAAMHAMLRDYRKANRVELSRLDAEAERLRALLSDRNIASDRKWAFPLHADEALLSLQRAIRERFDAAD